MGGQLEIFWANDAPCIKLVDMTHVMSGYCMSWVGSVLCRFTPGGVISLYAMSARLGQALLSKVQTASHEHWYTNCFRLKE